MAPSSRAALGFLYACPAVIMTTTGPQEALQPPLAPSIILDEANAAGAGATREQDELDSKSGGGLTPQDYRTRHHGGTSPHLEEVPPPPFNGAEYGQLDISQNGLDTGARVASDGRINIKINQHSHKLANLLTPAFCRQLEAHKQEKRAPIPEGLGDADGLPPPPMNVVIQIVGSRGDVQPFIALGQVLKNKYHHRVRIATHPTFRPFVTENGLEFFSIGGDPAELMAFMVKNPGLMPGFDSLKNGDVGKRRKGIYEIVTRCWRSCIEAGEGTGAQASDDAVDTGSFDSAVSFGHSTAKPFVADVIIANPPSFAHIHIAEKLGIPLHLMFTMPWSPTQSFPHPLANIISSNTDPHMTNFVTYALVDMLTWQGLGDVINRFRERSLGLEPVSVMWAPGMTSRLRIPWTYCWSPALIPKPADWGHYIDISGFFFLNLASDYTPLPALTDFLAAGPPPVYIGFGSIVVDDPNAMTKMIFEAVKKTGQRALVSKGWGGLGADELDIPDGIFMLGNCPHDWLFKRVSCVVHHGGAGTTAAGILAGRPTVVVPFFGDQPFWGSMTARAGAGPKHIPYKNLTADKLADAIKEALKPELLERAAELSQKIKQEAGCEAGAESFHRQLHLADLRCSLSPSRVAVWRVNGTDIRLSALAATVLGNEGLLDLTDLRLYRPREYLTEQGPWDPISGGAAALLGTIGNLSMGIADVPVELLRSLKTASMEVKEGHDRRRSPGTPASGSDHTSVSDLTKSSDTLGPANPETPLMTHVSSSSSLESGFPTQEDPSQHGQRASTMSTVMAPDGTHRRHRSWSSHRHSRSRSGSHTRHGDAEYSPCPGEAVGRFTLDSVIGGAQAVGKIVSAGVKSPMDFTLSLAKGFHNAPRLYGDNTVRDSEKITDLQSGLRAAGKEFGYGFYDGITGLVTQPLEGARREGAAGFVKGAAKGFGGLILKPGAGIWGLPGYTAKGIYAELAKRYGSSVENYLFAARTAQGYEEWKVSMPEERAEIVHAWKSSQLETRRAGKKYGNEKKQEMEEHILTRTNSNSVELLHGFKNTRHLSWEERKALAEKRRELEKEQKELMRQEAEARTQDGKAKSGSKLNLPLDHSLHHRHQLRHTPSVASKSESRENLPEEYEEAIRKSVRATSRGNSEEDALIERALRASVKELQKVNPGVNKDDEEVYARAVQASLEEVKKARAEKGQVSGVVAVQAGLDQDDYDDELARALAQSLEEYKAGQSVGREPYNDSGFATEDEEDFQQTVEESKRAHLESQWRKQAEATPLTIHGPTGGDDEENVKRAVAESEKEKKREEELSRQRTEEEIVMEYVKKQSLLEEEHKRGMEAEIARA